MVPFKKIKNIVCTGMLPFVVFVTGACVLIVEVLATRVLAPYFGNTIYTVSSVIGVVLGALSCGYYFGGRFSDRHPDRVIFYFIILAGGLSVFLLEWFLLTVMPFLGLQLSIVTGPLIASMILFFPSSFLLGCLSPYAITLQKKTCEKEGIGRVSGDIFFWSTVGSISGSLLSGFVLIPRFGINLIVIGVGCVLAIMGTIGISAELPKKNKTLFLISIGIVVLVCLIFFSFLRPRIQPHVLYNRDGVYGRIKIAEGTYGGHPIRFLQQDLSSSAAMFLDSDELVYGYTKYYALSSLIVPEMRTALVLGAGAYSIPKAFLSRFPHGHVDVVDIEPGLYELGKKYFGVSDTARLTNHIADGRRFLLSANQAYDAIYSDVYASLYAVPIHFTTREFFQSAIHALSENGIFIGNFIGSLSRTQPSFIFSEMRTFQKVFPNSYFFAVQSPSQKGVQNIIFVGVNGDKKIDMASDQIGKNADPIIRSLPKQLIDPGRFVFEEYPEFTDASAPVESALAPLFHTEKDPGLFDGAQAVGIIQQLLTYGDRSIGGVGHDKTKAFLRAEGQSVSGDVSAQSWTHTRSDGSTVALSNIKLSLFPKEKKRIILATHYDTQPVAFRDGLHPRAADPGANNGASGVATLLELARALTHGKNQPSVGVDIIFFDGEEGERGVEPMDWRPLGSQYLAAHLTDFYPDKKPFESIDIDMVCDRDLHIKKEPSSVRSAPQLVDDIWRVGKRTAPSVFSSVSSEGILDDHTSLTAAGIPSVLLIDFEYPWNYTTRDTVDKCSKKSLQSVGDTLLEYVASLPG